MRWMRGNGFKKKFEVRSWKLGVGCATGSKELKVIKEFKEFKKEDLLWVMILIGKMMA